jgi:hypothetical protein
MKTFKYHWLKNEPFPEHRGDRMRREGNIVEILRQPRGNDTAVVRVAIINLAEGEFIEELA